MSSELDQIIQLGHDTTAKKYYMLGTGAILFYDHLLTLADEIEYFWYAKKQWTFWLFVFNRYFPMTYQVWQFALSYGLYFNTDICNKTAWYSIFVFVVCTLLAQVVLTVRIYAVTMGNMAIATCFAIITVCQFFLGMSGTILRGKRGAQPYPSIPLDAYHLCTFFERRTHDVAYAGISLFYDSLAFSLIIFLAVRSKVSGSKVPSILRVMAMDATRYFLVIFTSHFVLGVTLIFGRESIQLLPAPGLLMYLPVMISRIMLSLRKAADPRQRDWSLADPGPSLRSMQFARPRSHQNEGQGDTQLDTDLEV